MCLWIPMSGAGFRDEIPLGLDVQKNYVDTKVLFFIHNSSLIIHNFLQRACYRAGIALEDKQ
jgi:hypothetical protein